MPNTSSTSPKASQGHAYSARLPPTNYAQSFSAVTAPRRATACLVGSIEKAIQVHLYALPYYSGLLLTLNGTGLKAGTGATKLAINGPPGLLHYLASMRLYVQA